MKLFTYSAKSADGRYNTKYGDVVAADEAEAKKKVAAEFEYKVNVDLRECQIFCVRADNGLPSGRP